jgi:hypothetical protein
VRAVRPGWTRDIPIAVQALRGVPFTVGEGQLVALRGRMGERERMRMRMRMRMRRETVAYIFQSFGDRTALEATGDAQGLPQAPGYWTWSSRSCRDSWWTWLGRTGREINLVKS